MAADIEASYEPHSLLMVHARANPKTPTFYSGTLSLVEIRELETTAPGFSPSLQPVGETLADRIAWASQAVMGVSFLGISGERQGLKLGILFDNKFKSHGRSSGRGDGLLRPSGEQDSPFICSRALLNYSGVSSLPGSVVPAQPPVHKPRRRRADNGQTSRSNLWDFPGSLPRAFLKIAQRKGNATRHARCHPDVPSHDALLNSRPVTGRSLSGSRPVLLDQFETANAWLLRDLLVTEHLRTAEAFIPGFLGGLPARGCTRAESAGSRMEMWGRARLTGVQAAFRLSVSASDLAKRRGPGLAAAGPRPHERWECLREVQDVSGGEGRVSCLPLY
ncbi:hypothetical protein COCON_G00076850 [Conger conger]|uniref:Uncharacterized protein n=1 Tax=Conger conger TaxID=82655 RepID=A0A9Q1I273_CONCO|nr:hypothetical protein COCON_G00076850 [Conger conger]